jgi:lipopolysaccharide/colanic/teichoic acid biosynthesis glycosyltransferase
VRKRGVWLKGAEPVHPAGGEPCKDNFAGSGVRERHLMTTEARPLDRGVEKREVILKFPGGEEVRPEAERVLPEAPWRAYARVKAALEWSVALLLAVLTGPLMLVLAAAVKITSRGPAFYAQTRLGRNGQKYRIIKLRTMVHNAEAVSGPVWAAKKDRRVTRLGKILRDTHLDELPQLWNVLRGDMALIGPRPERPELAARIEADLPEYRGRLAVRPGITGLAQMLAPADDPNVPLAESVRAKLAYDLLYVRSMGWGMDLRIAVATPCHFLALAVEAVKRVMVQRYGEFVEAATGEGEQTDRERSSSNQAKVQV